MKSTPCFLILTLLCGSCLLYAQGEHRGAIFGHITDPTGAFAVGVKVTVRNTLTNVVTELTTNERGYFEAPLLVPGTYRVDATAAGFKNASHLDFDLPAGSRLEVNFKLEMGTVTDSVTVSDAPPLLNADNAAAGEVLDSQNVRSLPWPGGNPYFLAWMTVGAQTTLSIADYSQRLHGSYAASTVYILGKVGGNDYTVDGTSIAANSRGVGFNPAPEFVQAVKVETSGFDASFGHSTGASVSVMTNSGTNQFHGTLREQHEQYSWRAVDLFTKQTYYTRIATARAAGDYTKADAIRNSPALSPGRGNDYAGSLGGPVVVPGIFNGKDKLFFFFGYAGFELTEYRQSYYTFPTTSMRGGDFSQLLNINATTYQIYDPYSVASDSTRSGHVVRTPFSGNIVPKSRIINPTYSFMSSFLPTPNVATASTAEPTNNYAAYGYRYTENYNSYVNRFDYNLSASDRFFARWSYNHWKMVSPGYYYYATPNIWKDGGAVRQNIGAGVDWVHNFGARTMLDVTVGDNLYNLYNIDPALSDIKPSDEGYPTYMDDLVSGSRNLPNVSWSGWTAASVPSTPSAYWTQVLHAKADLSHMTSKHTLKAGVEGRGQLYSGNSPSTNAGSFGYTSKYTQRTDDGYGSAGTGSYGGAWAAFMMGLPTSSSVYRSDDWAFYNPYYAAYVHDTWRASPRLTLNFGLRAEYELGPTERYNRAVGAFNSNIELPITAAAKAAYAANPISEISTSQFRVLGGVTYPGTGGSSRRLWSNSLSWLPRVAAAYQIDPRTVLRAGYGLFMDTLNVLDYVGSFNQLGYTWTQSTTISNDYGQTWAVGDPASGVSPMSDPFPARSDGTRFDTAPGKSLGAMAGVGNGFASVPYDRPHARQNRWRLDLQRQLTTNMMINVGYVGSYSDRLPVSQTLSALPAQYWSFGKSRNDTVANNLNTSETNPYYIGNFSDIATSNAKLYTLMSSNSFFTSKTIYKSALLSPYSQMNGLTETVAKGKVKTNEFDVNVQRRFTGGSNFSVSYTRQYNYTADYFPNSFDTVPSWEPSNLGRPHRVTAVAVAELPFGKGRKWANSGIASRIAGGFQLTGMGTYQPGALLTWTGTSYYSGNDVSDICGGPRTMTEWFNTDNFVKSSSLAATTGQARVFPNLISGYGGCRADSQKLINMSAQRVLKIRERMGLELRWDVYNVLNHGQLAGPTTTPTSTNFGKVTASFYGTGGSASLNRSMRIQARLLF